LLRRVSSLTSAGVQVIALLALSDEGAPAYDRENAAALAAMGVPAFACTPDAFPDLMAAAIERRDLKQWSERTARAGQTGDRERARAMRRTTTAVRTAWPARADAWISTSAPHAPHIATRATRAPITVQAAARPPRQARITATSVTTARTANDDATTGSRPPRAPSLRAGRAMRMARAATSSAASSPARPSPTSSAGPRRNAGRGRRPAAAGSAAGSAAGPYAGPEGPPMLCGHGDRRVSGAPGPWAGGGPPGEGGACVAGSAPPGRSFV